VQPEGTLALRRAMCAALCARAVAWKGCTRPEKRAQMQPPVWLTRMRRHAGTK